jgi:hypothetical protein
MLLTSPSSLSWQLRFASYVRTSNLHVANDGPCCLNIRDGNVFLFLGQEELIEDLQRRRFAVHSSLVNQGSQITATTAAAAAAAAAAVGSGSSWSAHGQVGGVR